ncbi:hypothetical protein [Sphingomonas sp. PP-F2F-G114-C0414]|nr:hypothetical protein [Sphingomonas sp. PP-F2F-G114-C0414]
MADPIGPVDPVLSLGQRNQPRPCRAMNEPAARVEFGRIRDE